MGKKETLAAEAGALWRAWYTERMNSPSTTAVSIARSMVDDMTAVVLKHASQAHDTVVERWLKDVAQDNDGASAALEHLVAPLSAWIMADDSPVSPQERAELLRQAQASQSSAVRAAPHMVRCAETLSTWIADEIQGPKKPGGKWDVGMMDMSITISSSLHMEVETKKLRMTTKDSWRCMASIWVSDLRSVMNALWTLDVISDELAMSCAALGRSAPAGIAIHEHVQRARVDGVWPVETAMRLGKDKDPAAVIRTWVDAQSRAPNPKMMDGVARDMDEMRRAIRTNARTICGSVSKGLGIDMFSWFDEGAHVRLRDPTTLAAFGDAMTAIAERGAQRDVEDARSLGDMFGEQAMTQWLPDLVRRAERLCALRAAMDEDSVIITTGGSLLQDEAPTPARALRRP